MPITRCPIVRLQAQSYGARGFTTDYHDWSGEAGRCKFCGVTRLDAQVDFEDRPRLGWRGPEVSEAEHEFGLIMATRPVREGQLPHSPRPD